MAEEIEIEENESEGSEELFEHHRYTVDPKQELLRIDKFLMDRLPNTSRNRIQVAARNGNILVNEKQIKPNYRVRPLDEISVVLPYPVREKELIPEDIPLDIVYEDDSVIVINKPSNMVVHPGYGNHSGTLVHALLHHFKNLPNQKDHAGRPGLVHRLDKNTTGLMVIAKTEEALTNLAKQFFDRTTKRTYNALVWGDPKEDEGTITGNLARSLKNRKIMQVFEEEEGIGKHAITHYKVLKRFGYVTLIECRLETGRTHQIRIHLKHAGHTLFNDPEYNGNKVLKGTTFSKYKSFVHNCFKMCERQNLHAKTLGFTHPETGEFMEFDSDLPDDMDKCLSVGTFTLRTVKTLIKLLEVFQFQFQRILLGIQQLWVFQIDLIHL